jgi:hypothetical protein
VTSRSEPNLSGGYLDSIRGQEETHFERRMRELGLTRDTCATSDELRLWCEDNRNRCYIPEWLLKSWGILVDTDFS